MAAEIPEAAVHAAAEAIEDRAMELIGRDLGTIHRNEIVAAGLAAALPHLDEVRAIKQLRKLHSGTEPHGYCAGCQSGGGCPTIALLDRTDGA